MRYAIIWLVIAMALTIGIGSINLPLLHRIADRGVRSEAIVVGLFPKNHDTLRYKYNVAGRIFEGQSQSRAPNPPLAQLTNGQSVVIFYDPEKPEDSVLGDPKPILQNETISVLLAATIVPTIFITVLLRRITPKKTSPVQAT